MSTDRPQLLLTIPDAAERLALSRAQIYLMVRRGEIPVLHVGRAVRVPAAALEAWVEQQMDEQGATSRAPVAIREAGRGQRHPAA